MKTSRRLNRSGYALVLVALSTMAIMASQVSTQGTTELYEMVQVNQRLLDQQMRWLSEGLLRLHQARCIQTGTQAPGNWNTVVAPSLWYDAGVMDVRSGTTRLTVGITEGGDVGPGMRYRSTVSWWNLSDGSRVTGDQTWALRHAQFVAPTFPYPGTLMRE